jgi:hypothetical protein
MRDGIFSVKFWRDTLERVIVTAAQCALVTIPVSSGLIQEIRWDFVAGAAGLGALTSLLKAIIASRIGRSDTASLVD